MLQYEHATIDDNLDLRALFTASFEQHAETNLTDSNICGTQMLELSGGEQVQTVDKKLEEREQKRSRPNAVFALHGCDVATDHAIWCGIKHESDIIAVAPCCQVDIGVLLSL